jgi:hypothetical protein
MLQVYLKEALKIARPTENPKLDQVAGRILEGLDEYLKGAKGFFMKQLVKKVKKRLAKDDIDDATLGYVIAKLFHEFDALDDLYEIFAEMVDDPKKARADRIVEDTRGVLNSSVIKAFTEDRRPQDFLASFEGELRASGVSEARAVDVAKILWDAIQDKLNV